MITQSKFRLGVRPARVHSLFPFGPGPATQLVQQPVNISGDNNYGIADITEHMFTVGWNNKFAAAVFILI